MQRVFTSLDQLPELLSLAEETCHSAGLPDSLIFRAQVVLEEIFVNIFSYAYPANGGPANIILKPEPGAIFLCIEDQGPAFDPLAQKIPDLQKRFDKGIPGGAGLVLFRSFAEDVHYFRQNECNILELRLTESSAKS